MLFDVVVGLDEVELVGRPSRKPRFPSALGLALCVAFACSSSSSDDDGEASTFTTSGLTTDSAEAGSEAGSESGDTGDATLESIEIMPVDPVVEVIDGTPTSSVVFTAVAHYDNGSSEPLSGGSWSFDQPEVASVNASTGSFSPTGAIGGMGTVRVERDGIAATTSATVIYRITHDPGTLPPETKDIFDGATLADPALVISYPYDQTVFPRGLKAPVPQWSGGADTDIYRFRLDGPYFSYESFETVPNPSRLTMPELPVDVWKKLEATVVKGDIQVRYQRFDGTTAYLPIEHTWRLADADLTGMIYYWAVNEGDVLRLPVGADAPETFLEKPPGSGPDAANPSQCIACHSVSTWKWCGSKSWGWIFKRPRKLKPFTNKPQCGWKE